jgi:RNase P subunit RPR2
MKEPLCALCEGRLVKEENVMLDRLGQNTTRLAWVCVQCGAAFPIAVRAKWGFGSQDPLYKEGKRYDNN